MSKYSIIECPRGWAVITPQNENTHYHTGRVWFPSWLPMGMTHVGIYETLEDASYRMKELREFEGTF